MALVKTVDIRCTPDELHEDSILEEKIRRAAGKAKYVTFKLKRRWIDARGRQPKYGLRYDLLDDEDRSDAENRRTYQAVHNAQHTVHIVGAGPAGYFAALQCLLHGIKPIILERGKDVRSRRRDLRAIQQEGIVNPDSNYCFGEGGAGTYSDGKLYTRAKKRGDIDLITSILIDHGADPVIGIDAHPHIGSNKLPGIIQAIRQTILDHGGEVRFDSRVVDIREKDGSVQDIVMEDETVIDVEHLVLATGHSARDIYLLFCQKSWAIEAKPFALGVRIEHAQRLIDEIQFGQKIRHENLPAAAYRLACEIDGRGVFSFCMCPGGLIVPASTHPGELVVNGMSLSRRDSPYANSGLVVGVEPSDLDEYGDLDDPLICMKFQQEVEKRLFDLGDGTQAAPAQRVVDFIAGRESESLPASSYIPGIYAARLDECLPDFIVSRMREGLQVLNKKMRGRYIDKDAVLIGVESRTSAPVRIPRDSSSLQHPDVSGLYPCAEGAGYAGGIMSAALDGQRVIEQIAKKIGVVE